MVFNPRPSHGALEMTQFEDNYGTVTARYYDAAYAGNAQLEGDEEFYRALAREGAGPVLELGCGTGRLLLSIAAEGYPCTGLDLSQAMLDALRAKSPPPTLRLVRAPMQDFDLGSDRFTLIYSAFRAFQHLYTVEDQLDCLACVRRHLAPGGIFAFDVFSPRLDKIAREEVEEAEDLRFTWEGDEVVRYTAISRDLATQVMHLRMRYARRSGGEAVENSIVEFDMRWFYRYELEHLLARAGFGDVTIYGSFDRRPVAAGSPAFAVVARV
jgi:SAM-dependent methyltransferase